MQRLGFSIGFVIAIAKEYPIRFTLWIVSADAATTFAAYHLSQNVGTGGDVIVAAGVIVGVLAALGLLLVYGFLTAPRRSLQIRVGTLEETVQKQAVQLVALMEERFGNVDRFVPIYHELRNDLAEAVRLVRRAQETSTFWTRTEHMEDGVWKKHKKELATHLWSDVSDDYGVLDDAFQHIRRLSGARAMRFRSARVRASDDLPEALRTMEAAEAALDRALAEAGAGQLALNDQSGES